MMRLLDAELHRVIHAADAIESFLIEHAPHWAGYGRHLSELASAFVGREVTLANFHAMQDAAYGPFRGTFGSMHDLSFFGNLEDEYQRRRMAVGQALDALEQAIVGA